MTEDKLTVEEKQILLRLARQALETGVRGQKFPPLDPESIPPRLKKPPNFWKKSCIWSIRR